MNELLLKNPPFQRRRLKAGGFVNNYKQKLDIGINSVVKNSLLRSFK